MANKRYSVYKFTQFMGELIIYRIYDHKTKKYLDVGNVMSGASMKTPAFDSRKSANKYIKNNL